MTKLALVLGGHASLGAYSAGAATEILTAAGENRREDGGSVGVVTGSGLGAVSASLAARSLAVNAGLVPWIGRLWVEALDARHLLPETPAPDPGPLDATPLEELTAHMLAGPPAEDDRPSAALGEELHLGIDLSAVGERRPAGRRGPAAVFELGGASDAADPVWQRVRGAALAAASAPLELAPGRPGRDGGSPGDPGAGPPGGGVAGDGSDGAEATAPRRPRPLALARRLMRRHGGAHGHEWRVLVLDPDPDGDAGERRDTLLDAAARLLRAGLADEVARDASALEDADERSELLRALVERLPEIHGGLDDPDAVGLGRRIGELAERVAERDVRRFGSGEGARTGDPALRRLDDGLRRIQDDRAYRPVFRGVETRAGRTRLAKLVYVLEALGDLQGVDPARVHPVRPESPQELAGRGLGGYGGFAVGAWRRHDFVAGRRDARRVLEGPLSDVVAYEPAPADAYEPPAAPPLGSALDRRDRRRLRDRLGSAAGRALDDVAPGGLRGVFYRLARPGLRRSMGGRLMAALEAGAAG